MLGNKGNFMRSLVYITIACLAAAALLSGCSDRQPQSDQQPQSEKEPQSDQQAQSDKDKLQGSWQMVSAERRGSPLPDFEQQKIIIDGDRITFKQADRVMFNGLFRLDPSTRPKTMLMRLTEDAQGHSQGEISPGIYEVEGDTFKWCNAAPGEPNGPTEFSTNREKNFMLLILKREKQ